MPLPNKTELSLAPNNLTMKNLMEKQRDSIQGSGKAYSSTTIYEKYDTSIYDEIEYISIYSDGNTQHTNQQPDVSPTYWQDKRVFDKLSDNYISKVTSTDNAIPKFNGITGEIQDTGVSIDDNNFITTQIFNQDGTEFDGVAYVDLDAIGANPTAKIYPDGTIVGNTSNGGYVKYPNGELECRTLLNRFPSSASANTYTFIWSYPVAFISIQIDNLATMSVTSGDETSAKAYFYTDKSTDISGTTIYIDKATTINSVGVKIVAKGRWK